MLTHELAQTFGRMGGRPRSPTLAELKAAKELKERGMTARERFQLKVMRLEEKMRG